MRVRDIDGMRRALERIGQEQIGMHVDRHEILRQLRGGHGPYGYRRFGLSRPTVDLFDHLFSGLPWAEGRAVVLTLVDAIGRDGRDLRPFIWRVLAEEVRGLDRSGNAESPDNVYVARLASMAAHGLTSIAAGQPWGGIVQFLDSLPLVGPQPNFTDRSKDLPRADHAALAMIRYATLAALETEVVVAAGVRRRFASGRPAQEIDGIRSLGEEWTGEHIRRALRQRIAADGALARAGSGSDQDARAAELDGYRRQGEAAVRWVTAYQG